MVESRIHEPRPFAALRSLMKPRLAREHCELCSVPLLEAHQHLVEPASRRLLCSCDACALLLSGDSNGKYRRVPRTARFLTDFRMTDPQWEDLHIPISLAFFFHHSPAGRVVAMYPSPAGPVESLLGLEAWRELTEANPILRELEPDVEALLVNRVGTAREYFRVPIDHCYRLVGIIRIHWKGLSGGKDVWEEIQRAFAQLKEMSQGGGDRAHA
jgi:hypothetical protein